jgi:RNA polymerase sigma-70 factor (ECF subfamily)
MLRMGLDALDLDRRAVLVAHDFDGTTGPEIAEALGIPLKTMYYRLRTGREQFVAAVRRIQARQRAR